MTKTPTLKYLYEYRKQLPGDLLFDNSITAMMLVDENRTIKVVNQQFCRLFGYGPEEVVGKRTSVLTPTKKHFEAYRKYFAQTRDGSIQSSELQYKKKNGDLFWVKLTGIAISSSNEKFVLWSFDDISEEVKSRNEIHNRYLELDIIFNKVPTGLVYAVGDIIERANPVFLSMVNLKKEAVLGKDIDSVLAGVQIEKESQGRHLVKLRTGQGTLLVELEVSPVDQDSMIILFHNVTRHVLEKKELFTQATTDGLTRLLNKTAFEQKVKQLLADPGNPVISMALLDIDFFKKVNDVHGHVIGDGVLTGLAALLNSQVRKSEVIGRIGGEEFGIVFLATKAEAAPICKRLLASVRSQRFTEKQLGVTISMGLTDTQYSRKFESLYTEADRLLYRAKNLGRDCLVSE